MSTSKSKREVDAASLSPAEENWRTLHPSMRDRAVRFAAIQLAKRRHDGLPANVVGVGFGPRKKRVARAGSRRKGIRLLRDEPCLVLFVDEKRPKSYFTGARRDKFVPPTLEFAVPYRGRRVLQVAIPTDVVQSPRMPRAQTLTGVQVTDPDHEGGMLGSIAAVVKTVGGTTASQFLLTCHHVAYPDVGDSEPGNGDPPDVQALPGLEEIGISMRGAFFGYDVGPCVDAAIIRLTDGLPKQVFAPPRQPTGFVSSFEQIAGELPSGVFLFSKHHPGGAAVTYGTHRLNFDVGYESGNTATLVEVAEYQLSSGTQGGDSGGALISGNGILIGMHVAGDGATGYAIPAYKLLMASAFDPRITLAAIL